MSKDAVYQEVIEPMRKRWKVPAHVSDVDAVLRDFVEDLEGYSVTVLAEAFKTIRKSHKYTTWPSVAEFVQACEGERKSAGDLRGGEARDCRVDHAVEAHRWARKWMNARLEIWENGWFMFLRPRVERAALDALKNGREPEFTITPELEVELTALVRRAKALDVRGSLGR